MRSYFCEEEIFPNDLSSVNKVSTSLSEVILANQVMKTCTTSMQDEHSTVK